MPDAGRQADRDRARYLRALRRGRGADLQLGTVDPRLVFVRGGALSRFFLFSWGAALLRTLNLL